MVFYNIQGFHLGQVPEGSVGQLADAVPLQFEDLEAGQTLKGQTLYLTYTVPVQLTADRTGTENQSYWHFIIHQTEVKTKGNATLQFGVERFVVNKLPAGQAFLSGVPSPCGLRPAQLRPKALVYKTKVNL